MRTAGKALRRKQFQWSPYSHRLLSDRSWSAARSTAAIVALLLATSIGCNESLAPPPERLVLPSPGNDTTFTGTVVTNSRSCVVDGNCSLDVVVGAKVVTVVYGVGRGGSCPTHIRADSIEAGETVRVRARVVGSSLLSTCGSSNLSIDRIGGSRGEVGNEP